MASVILQRSVLVQIVDDYKKISSKAFKSQNEGYVKVLLKDLDETFASSKLIHAELLLAEETDDIEKYKTDNVFGQIREAYHTCWAKLDNMLPKRTAAVDESLNQTLCSLGESSAGIKLPRLNIPQFSGNYDKWKDFYNLFTSTVHEDKRLKPVQKLQFLFSNIVEPAKNLIKHYTLEDSNYEKALNDLKEEYDHARMLTNTQLQIFFDIPAIESESASAIKNMIHTTRQCLVALNNLGVDTSNWDCILNFILQQKLPSATKELWEEKLSGRKDVPTHEEFKTFLECRFRSLEMLDLQKPVTKNKDTKKTTKTFQTQGKRENKKPNKDSKVPKSSIKCNLCSSDHILARCQKFLNSTRNERHLFVTERKLCINCFSPSHQSDKCYSFSFCRVCHKRHHTLLHEYQTSSDSTPLITPNLEQSSSNIRNYHLNSRNPNVKLLGTAQVLLFNSEGHYITVRALVDPGSDESYIVDSTVKSLGLEKYYSPTSISVIGDQSGGQSKYRTDIMIGSIHNSFRTNLSAIVVQCITSQMPSELVPSNHFPHLQGLDLADPSYDKPGQIQMLLGVDIHADIRTVGLRTGVRGDPIAEKSRLGWIVRGNFQSQPSSTRPAVTFLTHNQNLNFDLEKFWNIENVPIKIPKKPDDELCEKIFTNSVRQGSDGRFIVDLPFRDNSNPTLGSSRSSAFKRFINLERKLSKDSELKLEYHNTIKDYLSLGHMVLADQSKNYYGKEYVMPHHAVVKLSSSTTKVRVVFDASCPTTDSTSLNNHLLPGPKLQLDLRDILFQWRRYKYAMTADIARMYRQFWVSDQHHQYQMMYWRFSESEPIQLYHLTTVTFGTTSAPFLAIRLLLHLSNIPIAKQYPLASMACKSEFYVDDLLSGSHTLKEAVEKQKQIRDLLSHAKLSIRKWSSNSKELLSQIPETDRESSNELTISNDEFKKTLGIYWSPDKDCFAFFTNDELSHLTLLTKRNVLSYIARIFDPLGFISPAIMLAKLFMKEIWKLNLGWDDEVTDEIKSNFLRFHNELKVLKEHPIPRWINITNDVTPIEIYGFCDASELGYGAVIYLKNLSGSSDNDLILLSSKTKVAPESYLSIARLELCGALLLSELLKWAKGLFLQPVKIHAFTDSKIVLSWLKAHPSRWSTFIANRTTQILERISYDHWSYVETHSNPADLASRGLYPSELVRNDLWWLGPKIQYLSKSESEIELSSQDVVTVESEMKKSSKCLKTTTNCNDLLDRFSSHSKLLSITEKCCTFISNFLKKALENNPSKASVYLPIIDRMKNSEVVVLRSLQSIFFSDEIECLNSNLELHKKSQLRSFNPFVDGNGLLRVGGRLHNASALSFDQKHPIIIPTKHQVTSNIIRDAHERMIHGNSQETLAYIRLKFHIIRASDRVRLHLYRCVRCFKFYQVQRNELMGTLPSPRVNQYRPFLYTGVDYAGPVKVKVWKGRVKSFYKAYIAIFVCLSSKALHIELVTDLSSEGFLAAFRRFTSRRGRVVTMYSDNGTNFVGASRILEKECVAAQQSWSIELKDTLGKLGTTWHMIPPASPHFGGLWEAGVKSVKSHLSKIIKEQFFTYEELNTLLTQIEGVLNSRPLCPMSDNPDDYSVLTPSHFLIGEPIVAPPEPCYEMVKESSLRRWNFIQKLYQQFWHLWYRDYLHRLQKRPKWLTKLPRPFQVDDLVLIAHEKYPPTLWPLARITHIHPGNDGIIRVVTLRTAQGETYKRPITKLRLLPTNEED